MLNPFHVAGDRRFDVAKGSLADEYQVNAHAFLRDPEGFGGHQEFTVSLRPKYGGFGIIPITSNPSPVVNSASEAHISS